MIEVPETIFLFQNQLFISFLFSCFTVFIWALYILHNISRSYHFLSRILLALLNNSSWSSLLIPPSNVTFLYLHKGKKGKHHSKADL